MFLLPRAEAEEALSRAIFTAAFYDQYESEIGYLDSLNLFRGVMASTYDLEISVKGNSQANQQALFWLLEKLKHFEPTDEQLDRARASQISKLVASLDGFTAHTANNGANSVLHEVGTLTQEKIKILKALTNKKVRKHAEELFDRADLILAASGDLTPAAVTSLAIALRAEIPKTLKPEERAQLDHWSTPIRSHALLWAPLGESKAEDSFGHVRVYEGPAIGSEDAALFPTFATAFGNAVYRLNRAERKLGYVHNAYLAVHDKTLRFSLIGQTDGKDKFPMIEAGWKELIEQVNDGSFSRQHLLDTIEGQKLTLLLQPSTQAEEVDRLLAYYRNYKDLGSREKELRALETVTPEKLLELGRKYLKTSNFLEVIAAKSRPCKEAMSSLANARRKLTKG